MTPAQKAAQTAREHREQRKAKASELCRDREQAIAVCRKIRDDENAADADRLEAVRILQSLACESNRA